MMASAIDSLDDRSRERVEEARVRARPGIVAMITFIDKLIECARVESKGKNFLQS